jgi:hypothetical protein
LYWWKEEDSLDRRSGVDSSIFWDGPRARQTGGLRERPPILLRSSLKAGSMEGDTGHKAEVGRIIGPEKAADVLIVC